MSRFLLFSFFILSLNMSLILMGGIDNIYITETNRSLFGATVEPLDDYLTVTDFTNANITINDSASMQAAKERSVGFGPQSGVNDDTGFWGYTKASVSGIVNFFWDTFFLFPSFLRDKFGMPSMFVYPMYVVFGIIQLLGVIELFRGKAL